MKTALIMGASGLVGMSLLSNLLQDPEYSEVRILVRRKQLIQHPKLIQIEIDFDRLADYSGYFKVQDLFCCLGTTMKKAKSKEAFRKVDYMYPLQAAQISSQMGVEKFLVVSAIGADAHSRFFYNRVKGEVEREIAKQGVPAIFVFRPSLLLGERREFRLGEKIASWISPPLSALMVGPLKKYKPIQAKAVADAMLRAAKGNQKGFVVVESEQMQPEVEQVWKGIR